MVFNVELGKDMELGFPKKTSGQIGKRHSTNELPKQVTRSVRSLGRLSGLT
jgi:hypothetical protein